MTTRSAAKSRPQLDPVARCPGRSPLSIRDDCAVCGSPDIRADEAMHRGLWLLGECGRCGHRWTAGPFDGPLPAPASVRPVAAAPETAHIVAA